VYELIFLKIIKRLKFKSIQSLNRILESTQSHRAIISDMTYLVKALKGLLMRTAILVLVLAFGIFPIPALAARESCNAIVNSINTDINKYATSIQKQNLPWRKLSWFQAKLGQAKNEFVSKNKSKYKWSCTANNETFIIITTDQNDALTDVMGQYNSENGAGLFSLHLEPINPAPEIRQIPIASINPSQHACDETIHKMLTGPEKINLTGLTKQLGEPLTRKSTSQSYSWGNYEVTVTNGAVDVEDGVRPDILKNQGIAIAPGELIKLLGKPKKITTYENPGSVLYWQCPASQSELYVVSEDVYSGQYCNASGCWQFNYVKNTNMLPATVVVGAVTVNASASGLKNPGLAPKKFDMGDYKKKIDQLNADRVISGQQTVQLFKTGFNVNTTADQLDSVATQLVANYYVKLKQCLPGTYSYPWQSPMGGSKYPDNQISPLYNVAIATIAGYQNNKCAVSTIIKDHYWPMSFQCHYTQDSLNFIVDRLGPWRIVIEHIKKMPFKERADIVNRTIPAYEKIFKDECTDTSVPPMEGTLPPP
jgi:hypothetical protein